MLRHLHRKIWGGEIPLNVASSGDFEETEAVDVVAPEESSEDMIINDEFINDEIISNENIEDSFIEDSEVGEIDLITEDELGESSENEQEDESEVFDEEFEKELEEQLEVDSEDANLDEDAEEEITEEDLELEAAIVDPTGYLKIEGTTVTGLQDKWIGQTVNRIEIPRGVTRIADNAFQNQHIYYVTFPETLTDIGAGAFYNCYLQEINFPDSLKTIGAEAFFECFLPGSPKIGPTSLTIPKNVTNIGTAAFYGCVTIKDLTINSNVIKLTMQGGGTKARFGQCEIENIYFGTNVNRIPAYLFQGAKFKQTGCDLVIPKQIKTIEEYAFHKAEKINSIRFEEGSQLYLIGHDAFYEVFKENKNYVVDLSNTSLNTIGYNAFYGCKYLGNNPFSLPNGIKQIGDEAFYGVNFSDLYLPGTITYIGKKAFTTPSTEPYTWIMTPENSYAFQWFEANCRYFDYTATYPITYVLNGGVNNPDNVPYYYHTTDNKYFIDDPEERDMYTFKGWYLDAKFTKKIEYITNDYSGPITLYAKWEGIPCTVKLHLFDSSTTPSDGGSTKASLPSGVSDTLTINYDSAVPTLPTPTRPGYTFSRWVVYDVETNDMITVKKGDKYRFYEDERFYAIWTPITYTVKLHSNLARDTVKSITLTFDKVETITNPFVNHGYQIECWADSEWNEYNKINSDSSSNNGGEPWNLVSIKGKSIDLYAEWKESVYNVTFDYNGGNKGSYPTQTTVKYDTAYGINKDGSSITWPAAPTKSGCNFIGWFDEFGNEITENTHCVIEKDHTLIAYWQEQPTLEDVKCYVMEPGDDDYTEIKSGDTRYDGNGSRLAPEGTHIRFVGEGGSTLYWANSGYPTTSSTLYENEFVVNDDFAAGKTIKIRAYKDGSYSNTFSIQIKKKSLSNEEKLNDIKALDFKAIGGNPDNPDMSKVTDAQDENGFWITVGTEYDSASPKYWKEGTGAGISVQETGAAYKFPYVHVYYGKNLLAEKTDYSISYKNNTKPAKDTDVNAKNVSIAPIMIVSLKGNYSGKLERVFTIEAAVDESGDALININKFKVNMPNINTEYTGRPVGWGIEYNPAIEVISKNKEPLSEGTDYECEYYNNVNVGTATLVIKGIGNYCGRIEKTFKVTPYDIGADSKCLPSVEPRLLPAVDSVIGGCIGQYNVNCKVFIMDDTVSGYKVPYTASKQGTVTTLDVYDKVTEQYLKEGVDYTLKFSNNKAVCDDVLSKKAPMITITGKGNYKGTYSAKVVYQIAPGTFNKPLVSDVIINEKKAGLKPLVVVTEGEGGVNKLKEKTDYTVEFYYNQNNVEVICGSNPVKRNKGSKFDPKDKVLSKNGTVSMKAVINGVKNFAGCKYELDYSYVPVANGFDDGENFIIRATATNVAYAEKAGVLKPTIKITQVDAANGYTKDLNAGTDYDKNFIYKYANDTLISQKDKKVTIYKMRSAGAAVDMKNDIIPAGTKIMVNIEGIKSYDTSSVDVSFYVLNSLKSAKATINPKYFTGNPIYLTKSDMTVTIGSGAKMITLTPSDYEIIGYKNNTKKGTAKVTIKGIGKYMDSKEVSFTIKAVGQK